MTVMYHAVVNWSGFPGAPGFTNLYAETTDPLLAGAEDFTQNIDDMITHWANTLTAGVSIQVSPEVETIDDLDGTLLDVLTVAGSLPTHAGALRSVKIHSPVLRCSDSHRDGSTPPTR